MEIIPAIDLKAGAAVQLVGGNVDDERVHIDDPVQQAKTFVEQGARWIHIVDLDRALGTGSNLNLIRRLIDEVPSPRYQVGGGIRFTEDIDDLLTLGAARVIVGTRAVTDEKWSQHVAERYGKRVMIAVDARGDDVLIHGWKESSGRQLLDLTRQADGWGTGGFVYTDVVREGRMEGANIAGVERLAKAVKAPVIASGGISSLDDLKALDAAGAWGAVIGMAAYTGELDLKAAHKHFRSGNP